MNVKLIQQYEEEILCYRLRTARSKTRAQYKDFHKHLIALHREQWRLIQLQRNLGWEPLEPPIQKGCKRLFFLRQDVARSRQAEFYEDILTKINTVQWSHRKDFVIKKKRRALGRKQYMVKEQHLLKPDEDQFQKMELTSAQQSQFHIEWTYQKGTGKIIKRYVFNEPWRFVLRVRPNIIDKVSVQDPGLDARLHEISNYLERNGYDKIQDRLLDVSYRWWKWGDLSKHKEINDLKNKPLHKVLDELQRINR